jgi:hypothetical protein
VELPLYAYTALCDPKPFVLKGLLTGDLPLPLNANGGENVRACRARATDDHSIRSEG